MKPKLIENQILAMRPQRTELATTKSNKWHSGCRQAPPRQTKQASARREWKCRRCRGPQHQWTKECPAKNKTCRKCGKTFRLSMPSKEPQTMSTKLKCGPKYEALRRAWVHKQPECNVHSLRSTSGATCADLLAAGMQPVTSPHACAEVGLGLYLNEQLPGQKTNALPLCQQPSLMTSNVSY